MTEAWVLVKEQVLELADPLVADSVPELEHEECINKMAALQRAVDLAETGAYGR